MYKNNQPNIHIIQLQHPIHDLNLECHHLFQWICSWFVDQHKYNLYHCCLFFVRQHLITFQWCCTSINYNCRFALLGIYLVDVTQILLIFNWCKYLLTVLEIYVSCHQVSLSSKWSNYIKSNDMSLTADCAWDWTKANPFFSQHSL